MKIKYTNYNLGVIAGVAAAICNILIALILLLPFANKDWPEFNTVMMIIILPNSIAIYVTIRRYVILMFVCLAWILPMSIYLSSGEGIFKWVWILLVLFFISCMLMLKTKLRNEGET